MKLKWTLVGNIVTQLYSLIICRPTFPPQFPSESDETGYHFNRDYDYLNFSIIKNPDIRRYTEEFNAWCPHTDLCDVSVYYNDSLFRSYGEFSEVPCCEGCSCGSNCLEKLDCCIDILPRLLTTAEVRAEHENPAKCINTQYRPYDRSKYNGLAHILITKCSESYTNKIIIDDCLKSYSDFDFVSDIPGYLPVTDNRTMASYKNLFCGLCNHVPLSELIFWDAEVECNESIVLDETEKIQSLSEIQQLITRDARCNLVFKVPYYLQYRQPFIQGCNSYIDRCNVTGLWQHFDAELETLCMSYLSSYKGYKNIHCYLCNGFNVSTIEDICIERAPTWRPSSFVSLLDFNNLEPPDPDKEKSTKSPEKQCAEGQKYDVWAEICRRLFCPDFAILKERECHPIFDEGIYDLRMQLVPTEKTLDVRLISTLQNLITDDVSRIMFAINVADVEMCNVNMFVKMDENMTTFKDRLQQASFLNYSYSETVNYVALRLLVSVRSVRNTVETIKAITDTLFGQEFQILSAFQTYYFDQDFALFERQHMLSLNLDEPRPPGLYDRYRFFDAYEDPLDGKAILPVLPQTFNFCPHPYRLLPFNFCPLIHLQQDEFHVGTKSIYLKHKDTHVDKSKVVLAQNRSIISLCGESYFSNDNQKQYQQTLSNESPYSAEFIVSVICTSISLFSLFIVFVTYCLFKALRTLPGLNNMALVLSLFFAQLFYLIGGGIEIKAVWLCETIGLLLHFCLIASFFWMGICTFHMMLVFVFISKRSGSENTTNVFVKYAVIATLAASVVVCINIIVSVTSHDSGFGYGGQPCYITEKRMILFAVAIPLGVVIVCNLIMFLYVIVKVSRLPDVKKNTKHERRNIVIFAKLSTLTGFTWIFAYIYQWAGFKVFAYLFIVANASQGLFIMFSFVINKRVHEMFRSCLESSVFSKSRFSKTYETSAGT